MTEQNPAIFLGAGSHPAEDVRRWISTLTGSLEGFLNTGDLLVEENALGADMSVDVAAGRAYILGTEGTYQGTYFVENRASTNVVISASDPSDDRIDLLVAKVQDANYSGATNAWSLAVVTGTPAGSPVAPALPDNALQLATIAVAAGVTSIVDANITDDRTQFNPGYAQEIFTAGGTWTKADYPWAKWVRVRLVGGGGGGAGCATTGAAQWSCSGGGGGGGYGESTLSVADLGTTETVSVGASGAAGGIGASGSSGGSSSFGTHVVAAGGNGGGFSAVSAAGTGALSGGGGSVSAGQIKAIGSGGSTGMALGTAANQLWGGAGGGGGGGIGGGKTDDRRSTEGAQAGYFPGGGGSGVAVGASTTGVAGGAGALGIVVVEMFG